MPRRRGVQVRYNSIRWWMDGIEPPLTAPQAAVLPLHHTQHVPWKRMGSNHHLPGFNRPLYPRAALPFSVHDHPDSLTHPHGHCPLPPSWLRTTVRLRVRALNFMIASVFSSLNSPCAFPSAPNAANPALVGPGSLPRMLWITSLHGTPVWLRIEMLPHVAVGLAFAKAVAITHTTCSLAEEGRGGMWHRAGHRELLVSVPFPMNAACAFGTQDESTTARVAHQQEFFCEALAAPLADTASECPV